MKYCTSGGTGTSINRRQLEGSNYKSVLTKLTFHVLILGRDDKIVLIPEEDENNRETARREAAVLRINHAAAAQAQASAIHHAPFESSQRLTHLLDARTLPAFIIEEWTSQFL